MPLGRRRRTVRRATASPMPRVGWGANRIKRPSALLRAGRAAAGCGLPVQGGAGEGGGRITTAAARVRASGRDHGRAAPGEPLPVVGSPPQAGATEGPAAAGDYREAYSGEEANTTNV